MAPPVEPEAAQFNAFVDDLLAQAPNEASRGIMLRALTMTMAAYLREQIGTPRSAGFLEELAQHQRSTEGQARL